MSFRIEAKIEGVQKSIDRLNGLRLATRNKTLRRAVTKSSRLIAKKAKAKCPVRMPGGKNVAKNITPMKLLKRSIGVKVKTYSNGSVVVIIGPKRGIRVQIGVRVRAGKLKGFGKGLRRLGGKKPQFATQVGDPIYEDPAKIAHLVEKGTKRSRAQPFLKPALDESKQEILDTFAVEIQAGLAAAARGK